MQPHKYISSLQNPLCKQYIQLQEKSKMRKKLDCFVLEGLQEIQLAITNKYQIEYLFFCEDIISPILLKQTFKISEETPIISVSKKVYKKLAYRESTEGVLAQIKTPTHQLETLKWDAHYPLFLVAESIEKPGNIGALLRTADAAKATAVLLANPKTDVYNPNIIRSSVGTVFTVPIATGTSAQIIKFLKTHKVSIYSALLEGAQPYTNFNYTQPTAIAVGTEASGLSTAWKEACNARIQIPMQGLVDSLNVSVAAAILLFEAVRQRFN